MLRSFLLLQPRSFRRSLRVHLACFLLQCRRPWTGLAHTITFSGRRNKWLCLGKINHAPIQTTLGAALKVSSWHEGLHTSEVPEGQATIINLLLSLMLWAEAAIKQCKKRVIRVIRRTSDASLHTITASHEPPRTPSLHVIKGLSRSSGWQLKDFTASLKWRSQIFFFFFLLNCLMTQTPKCTVDERHKPGLCHYNPS